MNWDWEKLQEKRQRPAGAPPELGDVGSGLQKLKGAIHVPGGMAAVALVVLLWLLSGIYIVEPDEVGVVKRFGAFHRVAQAGPHYHIPFPVESVSTPKVPQVRRVEVGFRTTSRLDAPAQAQQFRAVPEESLMLTGDENIVDVQFIVQYQLKDPVSYLFNISEPDKTVKDAAEAAMREVIGRGDIDSALTTGKLVIQNDARDRLQAILDGYSSGIKVMAVQLQDVHPPKEVVEAFKDVASAREDKSRLVNEAEAYKNDLIPRTRGEASFVLNKAQAYRESVIRRAQGESARFLAVLREYDKARDVTRERLYLEAMEAILSNPDLQKIFLADEAMEKLVPYLPMERLGPRPQAAPEAVKGGRQ